MKIKIRKATYNDVNKLANTLAESFNDDPYVNWILRKDKKRNSGLLALFTGCLKKICMPHDEVFTTEDYSGTSLWLPPGKTKISFLKQLTLLPIILKVTGFSRLNRFMDIMDLINEIHPEKKHYFLQYMGVIREHRSKGIGSSLLKPIIEKSKEEKCGIYLENSKEKNISFYEKNGFKVLDEVKINDELPPFWPMWRD